MPVSSRPILYKIFYYFPLSVTKNMLASRLIILCYIPFTFIKNIRSFYHDEITINGATSNFILDFYLITSKS